MFNKKWYMPVLILILLGLALCFGGSIAILTIKEAFPYLQIATVTELIAVAGALEYMFKGCKKDSARYFRVFFYMYAVELYFTIIFSASQIGAHDNSLLGVVLCTIEFALTIVMAVGKDLGKRNSLLLCLALIVLSLIMLISSMVINPGVPFWGDEYGTALALFFAGQLSLSVVSGAVVIAKYEEKAERKKNANA